MKAMLLVLVLGLTGCCQMNNVRIDISIMRMGSDNIRGSDIKERHGADALAI